jgi:hypothetical protein
MEEGLTNNTCEINKPINLKTFCRLKPSTQIESI